MEDIFTHIYEHCNWGDDNNSNYKGSSGGGSALEYNKTTYIPFLKKFIVDNKIKTIVDLGSGDFQCGKLIYDELDISYTGIDAYKKIVDYTSSIYNPPKYSFTHLDFCKNKESITEGELCILKDVICHWSLDNIYTFLDYIVEHKKFKYILICNCSQQYADNSDIENGGWRTLSCDYLPLKKYNPNKLYNYNTKEICVISTDAL